ncbi:ORF MSV229 leucine rich repeat gene family protein, similar to Amsacta moorei entomopoxvirus Q3 ORF SW:P28854 [Melanoplus sanguinipes entomopoxvirus]|uniref:ORF MSV229 leucine rich repeat gene family protein, similar to Amsacta moorei entomopoxvirus Q3 ORF SW:P28854 n=1 Tax=Melanoplus sanguinipes entomopoxvirus TaxID=83191 RepID=Q9YVL3_MSEPV|nr:ORF MSV229 leucine rich repeat gene family protein, similar to Amsacta moorei entomopoxvirus Q3 ORF SW:P28854 [Melanoplus sanguinipes entomopoxvirus]AAC97712.1 ORF MSV229 leucine rich repeat gene family protein, similar to Amsacta moorei entomopoxvirus Q3 ORF SW:P28854 [Melanoplus sanguinipes entomopoxvirus 'O']
MSVISIDNEIWFKDRYILSILDTYDLKSILSKVHKDNRIKLKIIKRSNSVDDINIYINKTGLISLSEKLNTNELNYIINKYKSNKICSYNEYIGTIIHCFNHCRYQVNYKIYKYKIDLFFIDYKLAIECDIGDIDINYEIDKQQYIEQQIKGCKFIRFNPFVPDFNLCKVVNTIMIFMYDNK